MLCAVFMQFHWTIRLCHKFISPALCSASSMHSPFSCFPFAAARCILPTFVYWLFFFSLCSWNEPVPRDRIGLCVCRGQFFESQSFIKRYWFVYIEHCVRTFTMMWAGKIEKLSWPSKRNIVAHELEAIHVAHGHFYLEFGWFLSSFATRLKLDD